MHLNDDEYQIIKDCVDAYGYKCSLILMRKFKISHHKATKMLNAYENLTQHKFCYQTNI